MFDRDIHARGTDHHFDHQGGCTLAVRIAYGGLTIVQDCSAWTLADSFHPAFHVGNTGFKSPLRESKILSFGTSDSGRALQKNMACNGICECTRLPTVQVETKSPNVH